MRFLLLAFDAALLWWLASRVIVPLVLLMVKGLGMELPIPPWIAKKHPRLTIALFTIAGPLLFVAYWRWHLCAIVELRSES